MALLELFLSNGPSGFGYGSTAEQVTEGLSLAGKTMLVTGCNSGLGLEAMRVLALRGARVVGTARTDGEGQGRGRDGARQDGPARLRALRSGERARRASQR